MSAMTENKKMEEEDRNLIVRIASKIMDNCRLHDAYLYWHIEKYEKDLSTLNGEGLCRLLDSQGVTYYGRLVKL